MPAPQDDLPLRRIDSAQVQQESEGLADLYTKAHASTPGGEYLSREGFLRRLTDDAQRPGFDLLVATEPLHGLVFGVRLGTDGSWWQGFDGRLPQVVERLSLAGQVFAITALVVDPYARERGLAELLHERVVTDNRSRLGATLVEQDDHATSAAFLAGGWEVIGEIRRTPDQAVLQVLVLALSEQPRTLSRRT